MMKRFFAASVLAALIATPALAADSVPGFSDDAQTATPIQSYRGMNVAPQGYDSFAFANDNTGNSWSRPAWNRGEMSLGQDIGTDPDAGVRLSLERGSVRYE